MEEYTTVPLDEDPRHTFILNDNIVPNFSADALCEATVQVVGPETFTTSDEYKVSSSSACLSVCLAPGQPPDKRPWSLPFAAADSGHLLCHASAPRLLSLDRATSVQGL